MKLLRRVRVAAKRLVSTHQLIAAVCLVIGITLLLTGISVTLYVTSGASGLDLSRPGFAEARNKVSQESSPTFSSTGKLTSNDMAQFSELYTKERADLKKIGAFNDQAIDDETLGLTMPTDSTDSN